MNRTKKSSFKARKTVENYGYLIDYKGDAWARPLASPFFFLELGWRRIIKLYFNMFKILADYSSFSFLIPTFRDPKFA